MGIWVFMAALAFPGLRVFATDRCELWVLPLGALIRWEGTSAQVPVGTVLMARGADGRRIEVASGAPGAATLTPLDGSLRVAVRVGAARVVELARGESLRISPEPVR